MNYEHWTLKTDEDQILWLGLSRADSSVNSLNESVLFELDSIIDDLSAKPPKALIIHSLKNTGFIVGADINQFKALKNADEATDLIRKGQEILQKLEDLKTTKIALIEGFCLGGGLELALACDYLITEDSAKTRVGLPEVKLGIHPGWGGTVRLPRRIGALKAMDLILTGRMLLGKPAEKMGVVDIAVPKRTLIKTARDFALNPPAKKQPKGIHKYTDLPIARGLIMKLLMSNLNKKIREEHYPAPYRVVRNYADVGFSGSGAYAVEAQSIGQLLVSEVSRNLVDVFNRQELLKKQGKKDKSIRHVHVIGGGTMGAGIAATAALAGLTVTIQDLNPNALGAAVKELHKLASRKLKQAHLVTAAMDRLIPDLTGEGIARADVIVEAIVEKLEVKQSLFRELEQKAKADALLATNTSTIPLEQISTALKDSSRLVGIHYFNPVSKMPLVEVIKHDGNSESQIQKAIDYVRTIDKLPIVVKSAPGFLVNRILLPYMLEAVSLLEEGVSGPAIDKAAVDFGMPMGPIELADTVGLDICQAALEKMSETTGASVPDKLKELVAKGHLGVKTGQGFYKYNKKGKAMKSVAPSADTLPADLTDRLVLRMLNEASAALREGIVENADMLDAGCIFGFGFPPFRGGPISYARQRGIEKIVDNLSSMSNRYGERFAADPGWKGVAQM